jgi:hypothetical protein
VTVDEQSTSPVLAIGLFLVLTICLGHRTAGRLELAGAADWLVTVCLSPCWVPAA